MTDAIGVLLAFIALLVAWRQWKKTARAAVRDYLFNLRDELREHYVANGLDMTDGAYGEIRESINNLLRYTKDMRMVGFLYFAAHADRAALDTVAAEFEESIKNCDEATKKLIKRTRRKACDIVLAYMATTSIGFISAMLVMLAYLLPKKILTRVKRCLNNLFVFKPATLVYAATLME